MIKLYILNLTRDELVIQKKSLTLSLSSASS